MVAIDHEKSQHNHSTFSKYSIKSWEYWCKKNDWIIFGRYAGSRFGIEGGEVRILNEDEIIAVVKDPEDILQYK